MGIRDRLRERVGRALGRPAESGRRPSAGTRQPPDRQPQHAASRRSDLLRAELPGGPADPAPSGAAEPPPDAASAGPAAGRVAAPASGDRARPRAVDSSPAPTERSPAPPAARWSDAPAPHLDLQPDPYTATVRTPDGGTLRFTLREGESVCEAADRAGIELPSSCRSGGCLVCCGRLLDGEVEQGEQYVLDDEDIAEGFRLLCCTHLRSDAVFLSHQESEVGG